MSGFLISTLVERPGILGPGVKGGAGARWRSDMASCVPRVASGSAGVAGDRTWNFSATLFSLAVELAVSEGDAGS